MGQRLEYYLEMGKGMDMGTSHSFLSLLSMDLCINETLSFQPQSPLWLHRQRRLIIPTYRRGTEAQGKNMP